MESYYKSTFVIRYFRCVLSYSLLSFGQQFRCIYNVLNSTEGYVNVLINIWFPKFIMYSCEVGNIDCGSSDGSVIIYVNRTP